MSVTKIIDPDPHCETMLLLDELARRPNGHSFGNMFCSIHIRRDAVFTHFNHTEN